MKKFLSVLLALAVAFTFTFGSTMSAFAAPTNSSAAYLANVDAAYNQLAATLADSASYVKKNKMADTAFSSYTIEKAQLSDVVDAAAALVTADLNKFKADMYGKTATSKDSSNKYYFDYTVEELVAAYKNGGDAYDYEGFFNGISDIEELWTLAIDYSVNKTAIDKAAVVQFAVDKAELEAGIAAINTANYSTTTQVKAVGTVDDKEYFSAKDYADAIVASLVKKVQEAKIADDNQTVAGAYAAYSAMNTAVLAGTQAEGSKLAFYDATNKVYVLADNTILTTTKEAADNASLESKKQAKTSDLNSAVSNAYAAFASAHSAVAATDTETKNFEELVAAYKTIVNAEIAALTATSANAYSVPTFPDYTIAPKTADEPYKLTETRTDYIGAAATLAKVEALGKTVVASDEYSKTKLVGGKTLEQKIAADVAAVCLYAKNKANAVTYTDAMYDTYKYTDTTAFAKATAVAKLEAAYKAIAESEVDASSYYAPELAAVKAVYDKAIADINAAANKDAIDKIVNASGELVEPYTTEIAKINTKADVKELFTTTIDQNGVKNFKATWDKTSAQLVSYMNYKNADKSLTNDAYYDFSLVNGDKYAEMSDLTASLDDDANAFWINYFAESGVRSAAELTAAYADATALIDAVPLKADVEKAKKAAKESIEAAIRALPAASLLTVANKADLEAIFKSINDYTEAYGVATSTIDNYGTFIADVAVVEGLESKAIKDAEKAAGLKAVTDATIAKKAEVKALAEMYAAYTDSYKTDEMYEEILGTAYNLKYSNPKLEAWTGANDVTTYLGNIENLELAAVKKAIKDLPAAEEVTAADKEAVDAAKKLYDDYIAEYNYAYDATKTPDSYDAAAALKEEGIKLAALITVVDELTEYTDIHAKADLLDMSRKLTIWRTSKTSIRVTAVGSVKNIKDNGYTVKYSFYKKNPGASSYKLIKTTTSNKYTYTNLKKGTNKFQVKVKVYDADGKLVATKMTYYRAAKVK